MPNIDRELLREAYALLKYCGQYVNDDHNRMVIIALQARITAHLSTPDADARDAARYRWLRLAGVDADISYKFVSICESEPATPELFDTAIDAAMNTDKGEG